MTNRDGSAGTPRAGRALDAPGDRAPADETQEDAVLESKPVATAVRGGRRRVVAGVAALVLLVVAVVGAVPGVREELLRQAALSFTRQPTAFVELAFPAEGDVVRRSGSTLVVELRTRSHRLDPSTDQVVVSVQDVGRQREGARVVELVPGAWQVVTVEVDGVSSRWREVHVELRGAQLELDWKRVPGRQEIRR